MLSGLVSPFDVGVCTVEHLYVVYLYCYNHTFIWACTVASPVLYTALVLGLAHSA